MSADEQQMQVFRMRADTAGAVAPTRSATPDLVGGIQERQAHYDRLMTRCTELRRTHRCPGRCVLTGELGGGGLTAFARELGTGP